jgi:hypothetical protein
MRALLPLTSSSTGRPAPTAPRLIADALSLLVLASGPTILLAVLDSGTCFAGITWPPTADTLYTVVWAAAALLQLLWLTWILGRRLPESGHSPGRRAIMRVALAVLGTLVTAGPVLQQPVMTQTTARLLRTILLAWLAYEVCLRHRIPLSRPLNSAERPLRRRTAVQHTSTVAGYCVLGTGPTFVAVLALRHLGPGWLPVMRTDQASALGATSLTDLLLGLPWTIVLEGVVIGTVSLLLHTAHRPHWQIYTLIAIPEVIFHLYFGLPALLMATYAVLCARYYLHHHRIGPLLLGHGLYDLIGILTSPWPFLYRIPLAIALTFLWTAADRWAATPSAAVPPSPRNRARTEMEKTQKSPADFPRTREPRP